MLLTQQQDRPVGHLLRSRDWSKPATKLRPHPPLARLRSARFPPLAGPATRQPRGVIQAWAPPPALRARPCLLVVQRCCCCCQQRACQCRCPPPLLRGWPIGAQLQATRVCRWPTPWRQPRANRRPRRRHRQRLQATSQLHWQCRSRWSIPLPTLPPLPPLRPAAEATAAPPATRSAPALLLPCRRLL